MKKIITKNIYYIILILITFIGMLFLDDNGPLYNYSNYADVNIYYNIGKQLTFGKKIYIDLWDAKGPYMFFIGAISYLINKDYSFFFILNLTSIITFIIFNFKSLKLYLNEKQSFIYSLYSLIFCFILFIYLGSPETLLIGIISIFIYWILSDGFNKNNNKIFIFFGIFISFIFMTKINYLLQFGVIGIYYIYFSIKKKKNIFKEILMIIIGFLLGCIPIFIYDFKNKILGKTIFYYLKSVFCYAKKNNYAVLEPLFYIFFIVLFFIIISIVLFKLSKKQIKNYQNNRIVFIFFIFQLLSIIISFTYVRYYTYIFIPFIFFIFVYLNDDFSILKTCINKSILIYAPFLLFINVLYNIEVKNIFSPIQNNYEYQIFEDYKNKINDKSIVIGYLSIDNICSTYFDCQPTYKYWCSVNYDYNSFPIMYDSYEKLITNKEADFILAKFINYIDFKKYKNGNYSIKTNFNLQKYCILQNNISFITNNSIINNQDYIKKMNRLLLINYKLDNVYCYNDKFLGIFVPK